MRTRSDSRRLFWVTFASLLAYLFQTFSFRFVFVRTSSVRLLIPCAYSIGNWKRYSVTSIINEVFWLCQTPTYLQTPGLYIIPCSSLLQTLKCTSKFVNKNSVVIYSAQIPQITQFAYENYTISGLKRIAKCHNSYVCMDSHHPHRYLNATIKYRPISGTVHMRRIACTTAARWSRWWTALSRFSAQQT
jgi:hypothetical protein